jgi:hypothetical protein
VKKCIFTKNGKDHEYLNNFHKKETYTDYQIRSKITTLFVKKKSGRITNDFSKKFVSIRSDPRKLISYEKGIQKSSKK